MRLTPRPSWPRVKSRLSNPSRTVGPAAAISWALETEGRAAPPVPPSSWVAASVNAPSASRRAGRSPASWAGVRSTRGRVEAYWSSVRASATLSLSSRSKEFRALERPSRMPSRRANGSPSTIIRTVSPSAKAASPSGARPSQVRVSASTRVTFWQPTPGAISRRATSVAPWPASATPSSANRPPPSTSTHGHLVGAALGHVGRALEEAGRDRVEDAQRLVARAEAHLGQAGGVPADRRGPARRAGRSGRVGAAGQGLLGGGEADRRGEGAGQVDHAGGEGALLAEDVVERHGRAVVPVEVEGDRGRAARLTQGHVGDVGEHAEEADPRGQVVQPGRGGGRDALDGQQARVAGDQHGGAVLVGGGGAGGDAEADVVPAAGGRRRDARVVVALQPGEADQGAEGARVAEGEGLGRRVVLDVDGDVQPLGGHVEGGGRGARAAVADRADPGDDLLDGVGEGARRVGLAAGDQGHGQVGLAVGAVEADHAVGVGADGRDLAGGGRHHGAGALEAPGRGRDGAQVGRGDGVAVDGVAGRRGAGRRVARRDAAADLGDGGRRQQVEQPVAGREQVARAAAELRELHVARVLEGDADAGVLRERDEAVDRGEPGELVERAAVGTGGVLRGRPHLVGRGGVLGEGQAAGARTGAPADDADVGGQGEVEGDVDVVRSPRDREEVGQRRVAQVLERQQAAAVRVAQRDVAGAVQAVVAAGHRDVGEALAGAEGVQVIGVDVDRELQLGLGDQGEPQQRVGLALVHPHLEPLTARRRPQRDVQAPGRGLLGEAQRAVVLCQRQGRHRDVLVVAEAQHVAGEGGVHDPGHLLHRRREPVLLQRVDQLGDDDVVEVEYLREGGTGVGERLRQLRRLPDRRDRVRQREHTDAHVGALVRRGRRGRRRDQRVAAEPDDHRQRRQRRDRQPQSACRPRRRSDPAGRPRTTHVLPPCLAPHPRAGVVAASDRVSASRQVRGKQRESLLEGAARTIDCRVPSAPGPTGRGWQKPPPAVGVSLPPW